MIATKTGTIYEGFPVAKAIPNARPSIKLWIKDPNKFIYPVVPLPEYDLQHFLHLFSSSLYSCPYTYGFSSTFSTCSTF